MNPNEPVRILLVEDSPDDAELMKRALQDVGLTVCMQRVETGPQLEEALRTKAWDLIISDYHLPSFGAHDTLRVIREIGLDLPCIIVSGVIGEMAAVDLLKAGAADFVPKDNLLRLGPAIERELREALARAEGRKAEAALHESRARYQDLFEHSPVPIWIEDFSEIKRYFDDLRAEGVADFRNFFEAHPEAVEICAAKLRIVDVNHANLEFFHVASKEEIPRNLAQHFGEESWPFFKEYLIQLVEGALRFQCEIPVRSLQGETRTISLHLSVSPGFEGDLSRVLVSFIDLTERKRMEDETRASKDLLRTLLDSLAEGVILMDRDGAVLDANPSAERVLGRSLEGMRGIRGQDIQPNTIYPDGHTWPGDLRPAILSLSTGDAFRDVVMGVHKPDGSLNWLSINTNPIQDPATGELTGVVASFTDVGERVQNERRKTIISDLLHLLVEPLSQMELIRCLTEKLAHWTGCEAVGIRLKEGEDYPYAETRGFSAEFLELENTLCTKDAKGQRVRDPEGHPYLECMCGDVLCGRKDPSKPFFTPKGSFFTNCTTALLASTTDADRQTRTRNRCNGAGYESVALIPLRDSEGCFGLMQFNDRRTGRFEITPIHVLEEIGEIVAALLAKKKTDATIYESEERFRRLTSMAPVGVYLTDEAGKCIYANDLWLDTAGLSLEDAQGDGWARALHPDDREKISGMWNHMVESEGHWGMEYRFLRPDGRITWILGASTALRNETGKVTGYLGANVDISERKQMEESLRNMEQLSARGQMAAYIAHEINNPLAGIKNAFRLLEEAIPADHPRRPYADLIRRETDRISNIVRTMYSLYRPYTKETKRVYLKDVFQDLCSLLEPKLRSQDVEIRTRTVPPDLTADLPEGLIRQVLFNLIQNAVEASSPGNTVEVAGMREGSSLLLTITDQGSGIAAEEIQHVFRAGFTTKQDKEMSGLGLGLSTCKNLVESMYGTLDFFPNPAGRGTIFRVRLEIAQETHGD